jgi:hypothetical protein
VDGSDNDSESGDDDDADAEAGSKPAPKSKSTLGKRKAGFSSRKPKRMYPPSYSAQLCVTVLRRWTSYRGGVRKRDGGRTKNTGGRRLVVAIGAHLPCAPRCFSSGAHGQHRIRHVTASLASFARSSVVFPCGSSCLSERRDGHLLVGLVVSMPRPRKTITSHSKPTFCYPTALRTICLQCISLVHLRPTENT